MRLRFWLLVMDFAGWLDCRFGREWTGRFWCWSVVKTSDATDWDEGGAA